MLSRSIDITENGAVVILNGYINSRIAEVVIVINQIISVEMEQNSSVMDIRTNNRCYRIECEDSISAQNAVSTMIGIIR